MAVYYSEEEEKEFNAELKKLQNRAKRLILNDYYDYISLSELQYGILKQITNAETYKDINAYIWNIGLMDKTLDTIAERIKQFKKK